jgi:hypothetical protein
LADSTPPPAFDPQRFQRALAAFDAANAEDPARELAAGTMRPRELLHAERLAAWVTELEPNATEALRLAARCQHIRRWSVPREQYPSGRVGYLKWRKALARFHADTAASILANLGYHADTIEAVRRINLKQGLSQDGDVQTMEDALCLSFLEHELVSFMLKYPPEKVIEILRKTWQKMSERARTRALALALSADARTLVQRALSEP